MLTLGKSTAGPLRVDPLKLIDTRLLVQAASGGGKSWLLRLIAEQVGAKIPTIVLDPEGEFATLREKVDFLLVGPGGEVQADPRSAGLLARRLLELRVSAVVDLYELQLHNRRAFVRGFCEALIAAPKKLWAPTLIMLDEAHKYCPERGSGEAESTSAVIDLCSLGRKRGFGTLLATQRLSKLHKDAAAELMNVAIGRTTLDVDVRRALDVLGMQASEKQTLRSLEPGQFFAFGPAIDAPGVIQFAAGQVQTTHPKAGHRHQVATPAASKAIQAVAAELAELPKQAEAEVRDLAEAKREIAALKRQLRSNAPVVDQSSIDRAVAAAERNRDAHWQREIERQQHYGNALKGRLVKIRDLADVNGAPASNPPPATNPVAAATNPVAVPHRQERRPRPDPGDGPKITGGCLRMIRELANRAPAKFTEAQWATMSRLKRTGGTWSTYKSRLVTAGLVQLEGDLWSATDLAIEQFGDPTAAPNTPDERIADWKSKIGAAGRLLDELVAVYPDSITRGDLAAVCGLESSGGTFSTYLSRLRSNGLANVSGTQVVASEALFA